MCIPGICVSSGYVYPYTHIPSDMYIPGGDVNTDAYPWWNKEISSLAKGNSGITLSSFQAFPAVQADEFRKRFGKRYSYEFTQF